MAEGTRVTEFVFWPNFYLGTFEWGYTLWEGYTTWFTDAAPYFCDMVTFFVALLIILVAKPKPRWLWLNILIIGMLLPFTNSAISYFRGLGGLGHVAELLYMLNPVAIHLYFVLTLLFYAWGLYYCYFRRKAWHPIT